MNRDTYLPTVSDPAAQKGLLGNRITVRADRIDNAAGQIHAADALSLAGGSQRRTRLDNTGGTIGGIGQVDIAAGRLDNAGGALIQRGADGRLSVDAEEAIDNAGSGLIGAEGAADLRADRLDNSGGTIFSRQQLAVTVVGDALNREVGSSRAMAG